MKDKKGIKQIFVTLFITALLFTSINGNAFISTQPNHVSAATATDITSKKPTLSGVKRTATQVTLSYSKVQGADGYKLYRASTINGTYQYVGTSKSQTYIDTGLEYNKPYYYKVRAYKNVNGKKVHSKYSNKLTIYASFHKVELKVKSTTENSVVLSWDKVKGANKSSSLNAGSIAEKYKIYRSDSKNGTYEYIGIVTGTTFEDRDVQPGGTYYYRVRAYKKTSGIKHNGVYSSKVKAELLKKQTMTLEELLNKLGINTPNINNPGTTNSGTTNPGTTNPGTNNPGTSNPGTTNPGTNDQDTTKTDDFASQVLVLVNQEREKAGLNKLAMSDTLTPPANLRAKEIKESFAHTRPDGRPWHTVLDDYNIRTQASGENLAYGYNTPEAVVTGWMNSPGHRANILGKQFNNIGIGVYTVNGTVYCTQLFSN